MNQIKQLDKDLVNKIAAGEVIERPASVVKELVENSIDAEADKIEVKVEEAGKKLIRVKDNGLGMSKKDAKRSIKRHTTSKIEDKEDLFSINTLGFRGEALSSIASVSRMTIITKTEDSLEGVKLVIENGEIIKEESVGCEKGTIIEVKDLFYNTPARRKYMKTNRTELRHIKKYMENFVLGYPNVFFKFFNEGKQIITSPKASGKENLISIYGHEVAKNLIELDYSEESVEVKGYVSKPGVNRNTKNKLSVFINDRYIEVNEIKKSVREAYETMMPDGKYPVGLVKIYVPPGKVDVNVHPAKKEVKFSSKSKVKDIVRKSVRDALESETDITPEVTTNDIQRKLEFDSDLSVDDKYKEEVGKQETLDFLEDEVGNDDIEADEKIKVIDQIANSYIIAKVETGIRIIDQHAAQEKIYFNRMISEEISTQSLLEPLVLSLSESEFEIIVDNIDMLEDLGFGISEFGIKTIKIDEIPSIMFEEFDEDVFHELVNTLESNNNKVKQRKIEKVSMKACRSSVKAGKELTRKEMVELVNELMETDDQYTCPHGRPTMLNITLKEIEKMFDRR